MLTRDVKYILVTHWETVPYMIREIENGFGEKMGYCVRIFVLWTNDFWRCAFCLFSGIFRA